MKFKNINELYDYLNSLQIDDSIIIVYSKLENDKVSSLQQQFLRWDGCAIGFRKVPDIFGDYNGIYLYGYTKLSEVIIVHQTIECEVSV